MGTLARFNLAAIRELRGLASFVETGTGDGAGVAQALQAGFGQIHSLEYVEALALSAATRFEKHSEVLIHQGDSGKLLPQVLRQLPAGPAFFWLDAHFPGADYGMADYETEADAAVRLPLMREIELIAAWRTRKRDVILIDDARIYQPGPYAAGNLVDDWPPLRGVERSLEFVRRAFGDTHGIVVDHADQGYVMVFPKVN